MFFLFYVNINTVWKVEIVDVMFVIEVIVVTY